MFVEVLALAFTVLFIWCLWDNWDWLSRNKPPGPIKIPILGNLVQLGLADPRSYIAMDKLSKKYGDVMSLKLGFVDCVIATSYEAIKELSNRDETLGRLCEGIWWDRALKQNAGLSFSTGRTWTEVRQFSKDSLGLYGFGKRGAMEQLLQDEVEHLIEFMKADRLANNGRIHFSVTYFHLSFINIMASMVMGSRSSYEDKDLKALLQHSVDFMKNGLLGTGLLTAFPFLRFVLPETLGYNTQIKALEGIQDYARKLLETRRKADYKTVPICFTDEFLNKIDEDASSPDPVFTDDQFVVVFSDIMQGGSETTSNSLSFTLLQLANNPEVQERMHEEIIDKCGMDKLPGIDDKAKMPYCQAVILEGLRWARTVVNGIPKAVTKDFTYRQYQIKKGSVITINLHSVFFDEEFWGDPNVFRPERFLDANRKLISNKTERIISFGMGKRNCFGEVLARDSSFLYITALIQKFSFRVPPGQEKPSVEPIQGITLVPHPYDAVVELRSTVH